MPILNYTTTIDVNKTVFEIQYQLSKHGARAILTEFDDLGKISGISFKINIDNREIGIKLPSNVNAVLKILEIEKSKRKATIKATYEQAEKVAFRIIKDWVEAQMAIYETRMVKLEEVFLPYIITSNGQTLFQKYETNQLLLDNSKED